MRSNDRPRPLGHLHGQIVLACGQRLQIGANGQQVRIAHVLGAVLHHIDHVAGDRAVAVAPGLEQLGGFLGCPQIAQAQRAPVLHGLAGQEIPALAALAGHGFFLEAHAARRMAGAAVAQALHQVGAPVPLRALLGVGLEGRVIQEHPVPQRQAPALVEGKAQVGLLVGRLHRRHALQQIGVQGLHVLGRHLGVGGIGHGRIQVAAIGCHALAHGAVELLEAVFAHARIGVGRDIGGIDLAEWRLQRQPTTHGLGFIAGVAGNAIAQACDISATIDQGSLLRRQVRRVISWQVINDLRHLRMVHSGRRCRNGQLPGGGRQRGHAQQALLEREFHRLRSTEMNYY